MTDFEIMAAQERLARMTIVAGTVFLVACAVAALILGLVWLHDRRVEERNRHAEGLAAAQASRDIGCTGFHVADVHKDRLIRDLSIENARLRAWKKRTEIRMEKLHMADQVWGKESNA